MKQRVKSSTVSTLDTVRKGRSGGFHCSMWSPLYIIRYIIIMYTYLRSSRVMETYCTYRIGSQCLADWSQITILCIIYTKRRCFAMRIVTGGLFNIKICLPIDFVELWLKVIGLLRRMVK